jgi:hypothetical protein
MNTDCRPPLCGWRKSEKTPGVPTLRREPTKAFGRLPLLFGTLILTLFPALASLADDATRFEIAEKLWYADNGQEHALMGGGLVSFRLPYSLKLAGLFLQGDFHNEGDVETHRYMESECQRVFKYGHVGAGFSYQQICTDLKPGWEWDTDRPERAERNADIYGPYLSAGLNGPVFTPHLKWLIAASWMFKDFGGLDGLGYDGSHYTLKGGLEASYKKLFFSLGYQYERYQDVPPRISNGVASNRDVVDGVYSTAGVRF